MSLMDAYWAGLVGLILGLVLATCGGWLALTGPRATRDVESTPTSVKVTYRATPSVIETLALWLGGLLFGLSVLWLLGVLILDLVGVL